MRAITSTILVLCAASAAGSADLLRNSMQQQLRAGKQNPNNDPICYQILDTWWDRRVTLNEYAKVNQNDEYCHSFSGHGETFTDVCNNRRTDERMQFVADNNLEKKYPELTPKEWSDLQCTMIGTGHGPNNGRRCVAAYCSQQNDGKCTLEETGGQCVWWTKSDIKKINKFKKGTPGYIPLQTHGCYRNPCNMPGYGQADEECPTRGNGIFKCTWCYGQNDSLLKNKGMGCQAQNKLNYPPASTDNFAPINNKVVPDSTIMSVVMNNNRPSKNKMCSTQSRFCQWFIDQAGTASGPGTYVCRNGDTPSIASGGQSVCPGSS